MSDDQAREDASHATLENARRKKAADANVSTPAPGINWIRFWMQMLVAILVFNVIAGAIAWFFVLPHLHPAG